MDNTFIRKSFYIPPPDKNASREEWNNWLREEDQKAQQAKRNHTRTLEQQEAPEWLRSDFVVKSGGTYKQVPMVGFAGSDENCSIERAEDAKQDHHVVLANMERTRNRRGGSRTGKSARRRKNRKKR